VSALLTPTKGAQAIYRVNPVAKFGASFLLGVFLLTTVDWVSGAVALAVELVLFVFAGVSTRTFFARTVAVWIAAPLAGITIALYGRSAGPVYLEFWFARVSEGSVQLAIATSLRILAIALPAIVLFITVDPIDLADGLAQVLHLPARFVLGALAALRLVGLSIDDWKSLEQARRARGVGDRGRIRRFAGQAFALLVLSIRRGTTLATAMEARGFGAPIRRTWARESRMRARDWALILLGGAVGALAVSASIVAGTWNPLGS
jgi:energy-coupling factor transport system permease protein